MIRPTVFNKVVSELNELRLNMLVATKYAEDRKSTALLFDIALNAIYKELRAQKKPHQPELL